MTSSQKTIWDRIKAVGVWIKARYEACVSPIVHVLTWGLIFVLVAVMFSDYVSGRLECLLDTDSKKETLTFIGWGISGLLLLLGALSISKRADAQVENNRLVEIGNDNDRFKVAVDHLSSRTESARISSFYEFYYLAKNRKTLRESIFNILCAHLRQATASDSYYENEPTEEIQSLLDVLFKSTDGYIFEGLSANLHRVNLRNANLMSANLQEANLSNADLRNAFLIDSKLWGAFLYKTKLQNAYMEDAQLWGAQLVKSKLQNIDANSVQLQGADILNCNLSNANLKNANLQGAHLKRSQFYAAELQNCNLQGTNLIKTKFQGAYLHSLKLQGAKFKKTAMGGVTADRAPKDMGMDDRIESRANAEGNISKVLYSGKIKQGDVTETANLIEKHYDAARSGKFRNRMYGHINQPKRKWEDLSPEELKTANKGINLAPYTKEDAESWVTKYDRAIDPPF